MASTLPFDAAAPGGRIDIAKRLPDLMELLVAAPIAVVHRVKAATVSGCARAVLAGGSSICIGILWDISWHRTIGRDTFWTPAHIAIYLGGLLGGLSCGWLILRMTFLA